MINKAIKLRNYLPLLQNTLTKGLTIWESKRMKSLSSISEKSSAKRDLKIN